MHFAGTIIFTAKKKPREMIAAYLDAHERTKDAKKGPHTARLRK
jgi:hypothetical protein